MNFLSENCTDSYVWGQSWVALRVFAHYWSSARQARATQREFVETPWRVGETLIDRSLLSWSETASGLHTRRIKPSSIPNKIDTIYKMKRRKICLYKKFSNSESVTAIVNVTYIGTCYANRNKKSDICAFLIWT